MLCVIDYKSPCAQGCLYHYKDVHRAAKPYYRTCKKCGARLDPGEVCDCTKKERPQCCSTENAN